VVVGLILNVAGKKMWSFTVSNQRLPIKVLLVMPSLVRSIATESIEPVLLFMHSICVPLIKRIPSEQKEA